MSLDKKNPLQADPTQEAPKTEKDNLRPDSIKTDMMEAAEASAAKKVLEQIKQESELLDQIQTRVIHEEHTKEDLTKLAEMKSNLREEVIGKGSAQEDEIARELIARINKLETDADLD